ncbi:Adenosine deaminase [Blattella germanica]|nr:Adenosine deaminase [Blattella germanica]
MIVRHPQNLWYFLQPFLISTPCVAGDLTALERIAYEFCEDKAKNGVIYVEARYSPHLLLSKDGPGDMQALSQIVRAINQGFARGEAKFNIKVKSILCTLVGMTDAGEVLQLCDNFRNEGVVAMDMAATATMDPEHHIEVPLSGPEYDAFQEAYQLGIHRTIHAGESGTSEMVKRAVELYHAERIGHGYHVVDDKSIYDLVKQRGIHLENCPWSSYLTGSIPLSIKKHPIVQFAEDGVNFSLSTDDPTVTGYDLQDDYELAYNYFGLSEAHLIRANFNAARSSFLPDSEKQELIGRLKTLYGLDA